MSLQEPSQPVRVVVPDWLINAGAIAWRVLAAVALAGVIVLIATELFIGHRVGAPRGDPGGHLLTVRHRAAQSRPVAHGRRRRWSPSSRC